MTSEGHVGSVFEVRGHAEYAWAFRYAEKMRQNPSKSVEFAVNGVWFAVSAVEFAAKRRRVCRQRRRIRDPYTTNVAFCSLSKLLSSL